MALSLNEMTGNHAEAVAVDPSLARASAKFWRFGRILRDAPVSPSIPSNLQR